MFISGGGNSDLVTSKHFNGLKGQSSEKFRQEYVNLVDSINRVLPKTEIYIQSILPVNSEMKDDVASNEEIINANNILRSICKKKSITYIDLHSLYYDGHGMPEALTRDGIHLKPESYDRWAEKIRKYIVQ